MEIILTKQCESLTGSLGRGFGYSIRSCKSKKGKVRFFSVRNSKGIVPPDGHWRFILTCAGIAHYKLHIEDIQVSREELHDALKGAHHFVAADKLLLDTYDAQDIINLKTTFSL